MKPLSIEIQNFGPFTGPATKIDFTRLDSLFLISGVTGAGKTSIFDAMSYALYDALPGSRSEKTVRSQFATPEDNTLVTFTFLSGDREWIVQRSPYWRERSGRKGQLKKETDLLIVQYRDPGTAEWIALPGKATVLNRQIIETIGFSFDNFSRIILLPQGEFQRFLEMKTTERGELLEKLFPVALHRALEVRASKRAEEFSTAISNIQSQQEGLRMVFNPDTATEDEAALRSSIETAREDAKAAEKDWLALMARKNEADALDRLHDQLVLALQNEAELQLRSTEIASLDEAMKATQRADAVMSRMDQCRTFAQQLQRSRSKLEEHAQALATANRELAQVRERCATLGELQKNLSRAALEKRELERQQECLKSLKDSLAQTTRHTADIASIAVRLSAKEEEIAVLSSKAAEIRQGRTDDEDDGQQIDILAQRRNALNLPGHQADELKKLQGAILPEIEKQLIAATQRLEQLERLANQHASDYEDIRRRRASSHAAELSTALQEGQPCPVCGSTSHPKPATSTTALVKEEEEERARLQTEESNRKAMQARGEKSTISASLEEKKIRAAELEELLRRSGFVSAESVQSEINHLTESLTHLQETRTRRRALLQQADTVERSIREQQDQQGELQRAMAGLRAQVSLLEEQQKQKRIEADSPDNIEAADEKCGAALARITASIDTETAVIEALLKAARDCETEQKLKDNTFAQHRLATEQLEAHLAEAQRTLNDGLASCQFGSAEEAAECFIPFADRRELETRINEHREKKIRSEENLNTLRERIDGRPRPDLSDLNAALTGATAKKNALISSCEQLEGKIQELRKNMDAWKQTVEAADAARKAGAIHSELARDLNGTNSQNRSFSRWALGRSLAVVLEVASERFSSLSSSRYRFLLRETTEDQRSKAGLEIDVIDEYTQETRSVRSLSGGEKFLASMALALGLSDVIQGSNAGRRLDALFIDEGFGSLDEDTLQSAIRMLYELGEGRQVGIISHVETLKTAIPCQVCVEKGQNGSSIAVISS